MDLRTRSAEELISKLGFHFTAHRNEASILATGIEARLGSNSSGGLGKQVAKNAFISRGIEGCMKTFNRTLNAAIAEVNIGFLKNKDHREFIPESARVKDDTEHLSFEEALEFVKRYMLDNEYLVFEAEPAIYENEDNLTQEKIDEINEQIRKMATELGIPEDDIHKHSIMFRERTLGMIDAIRGRMLQDGVYDVVDFNEEHGEWLVQTSNNTHTRMTELDEDGKLNGRGIPAKDVSVSTVDGKTDAISIIEFFAREVDCDIEYSRKMDVPMIDAFLRYARLPEDISREEKAKVVAELEKYYVETRAELKRRRDAEKAAEAAKKAAKNPEKDGEVSMSTIIPEAVRDLKAKGITQDIITAVEAEGLESPENMADIQK